MKKIQLPSLAFGNLNASINTSEHELQKNLAPLSSGWTTVYEPLINADKFMSNSTSAHINGLVIGALASTPVRVKIKNSASPMLFIPLYGSGSYSSKGENIAVQAEDKAGLVPEGSYIGTSTLRSSIVLFIDPARLESTLRNMLGAENNGPSLIDLDRPQSLPLRYGNISFDGIIRQQVSAIDKLSHHPDLLNLSGLDDGIYRAIAMLIKPDLFKIDINVNPQFSCSKILLDRALQYIQENQSRLITLTDLEQVSCMSRRNLHYGFQRRFNCTPMQWVRLQRLETARAMLMKNSSTLTITAIALLCGFNKPSTFAQNYNLRFGELPSVTLARSLGY